MISKDFIVFVGHSMGGLVIKRAYIIAKQKKEFQSLAERIKTIIFLATPHRGSDLAPLLEKILRVTIGTKPYVGDLRRDSLATQSINEEFPHFSQEIQLYSFYETLSTNYGIGKGLVVEKDLATLGYTNERIALLNANHRDVCKYSSQKDPNYITVRNALVGAIENHRTNIKSTRHEIHTEQRRILKNFLGVSDAPEDDLMGTDALRMPGSCEWLIKKPIFSQWLNAANKQLYWISANPGTGKSVLSGRIVRYFQGLHKNCSFYFFNYGDKGKSIISSFLLSMAWQTAVLQPSVLNTVLQIYEKDDGLIKEDYRSVWRRLFLEGICKVLDQTHYWVIDALDECKNNAELVPFLSKAAEMCPIHIIVTSRNTFESYKTTTSPKNRVIQDKILPEDTKSDIALYIEANMDKLPSIDKLGRQDIVEQILEKSAGCFLWVTLVLQELGQVHMLSEVRDILDSVPSNMNGLYQRILNSMSEAPYGKALTKAILVWTVCAARPLKTVELRDALKLDLKQGIDSLERSIISSCGQLVYVDAQLRVQMVHQTARDFLLEAPIDSEFIIDAREGHRRIAMTCLEYLNGRDMKAPARRKLSASRTAVERSQLESYACNLLFEHIVYVSSMDDDFLFALANFLGSTNVLAWIYYIAQHSNLVRLIQTARSLGDFLKRRSKHMSPFGKEVTLVDSWSSDLVRLVTKFGKHLKASPYSIFHLIPPFCPAETALRKQLTTSARGISVIGVSATAWDDCLSTIVDLREIFSALACSMQLFALGMSSGRITIHNATTCQEVQALLHQEPVRLLHFGRQSELLASAGSRTVRVWNTSSWEQIWSLDAPKQCMALAFTDEDRLLLGAQKNNHFMMWDLSDGSLRDSADWTQCLEDQSSHLFRRPVAAAFCMDTNLLAIGYRGQDILLWDLENDTLHDTYNKQTGAGPKPDKAIVHPGVRSLIFSQAVNANLLAATYVDGDLILFDISEGVVRETTVAFAHILACSEDGLTLASGDPSGTVKLFEFESLKLLYKINSAEYGIQGLAFSGDSQHLLDIRGSQCRVWDPTVLIRQEMDEEVSDTVSVSTVPQEFTLENSDDVLLITALATFGNGDYFFCGKEDGSVCLYDTKSGTQTQNLFNHALGIAVVSLYYEEQSQRLISIDSASRIIIHAMQIGSRSPIWEAKEPIFEHRADVVIDEALSNHGLTRMLICSAKIDTLWSISPDGNKIVETLSWEGRGPYRWAGHPANPEHLVLIIKNEAHIYEWRTLRRVTEGRGIMLEGNIVPELSIRSMRSCFNGTILASTFSESIRPNTKSKLLLWRSADFVPKSTSAAPVPKYHHLADSVEVLIGASGQRLIFLHSDNWICSADPETTSANEYIRHFFLPADWLTTNIEFMIQVTCQGDIVFVKRDEVAVIKRGLESTEQGPPRSAGLRPSLANRSRSSLGVPPFLSP